MRVAFDWTQIHARTPEVAFPPLLLGCALCLWGYAVELLEVAVTIALAYELAPLVPWRWRFTGRDFNRLVDLSAVLFVVVAIYQFDQRSAHGVYGVLQWLPALLALLLLCQRFSVAQGIPLAALFLSVRRAATRGHERADRSIDFAFPFFPACLLSTAAGPQAGKWTFPAFVILIAWGLWLARSRRRNALVWLCMMAVVIAGGFATQYAMKAARRAIEPWVMEVMRDYMSRHRDPFKAQTAIGELGELKLSEQIEMRVTPDAHGRVPQFLYEATYRQFSRNMWLAGAGALRPIWPTDEGLVWTLARAPQHDAGVRISRHMPRGRGLLAVPADTWQLRQLGVETLKRHPLGALKVERGPELVRYVARFADASGEPVRAVTASENTGRETTAASERWSTADRIDRTVPREYVSTLQKWLSDRGIATLAEHASSSERGRVVAAIMRGFLRDYSYAVTLPSRIAPLPLRQFLQDTRRGHCEFFATATVLLLRQAGIPARYATGYAVSEWSELEQAFVVRRRHAHAWANVHIAGQWSALDTTPAGWQSLEADAAPWWNSVYGLMSWLRHLYLEWRWREEDTENSQPWLLWAVIPLIAYLVWRLRAERIRRETVLTTPGVRVYPGTESALFAALHALELLTQTTRAPAESVERWLARLETLPGMSDVAQLRVSALPLHQRLRFDPDGLPAAERSKLEALCVDWTAKLAQKV